MKQLLRLAIAILLVLSFWIGLHALGVLHCRSTMRASCRALDGVNQPLESLVRDAQARGLLAMETVPGREARLMKAFISFRARCTLTAGESGRISARYSESDL